MERLSGMDASFVYLETPTLHMHVSMLGIYDTTTVPGGYRFDLLKDTISERLHLVPPFTQRLVEVPFKLHHPVWVNDPHFDIDYHVRRIAVPAPGGRRELGDLVGQLTSVPLDRTRPLWEAWVIEGLKHDRVAFLIKIHHACIDGASGAELMTELYDVEPEGREIAPPDPDDQEQIPTDAELVGYALVSKARNAWRLPGLLGKTVESATNVYRRRRDPAAKVGATPLTAPRTSFNGAITAHRKAAFARIPLDETKEVKDIFGVKVNDVVLAVTAGALRAYLERREELPPEPLLAVVPISVRAEDERGQQNNRVSAMFTSLATDIDDPVERLRAIAESTEGAKEEHNAAGARMLTDWTEYAPRRVFGVAVRAYSSMHLANRHRPIHNLVISNVPGPPFPLYFAGAELVAAYPMGPIMEGAGLNATVLSYRHHVDFGFLADRELVPDVWDLAEGVAPAFEQLREAAKNLG
ncbi:MAG: putative diacylglycerol O-acyltransferase [Acidimicrobiales bacterium]|nr:MAG: wax ester/triacylglycerol synthase family O-acyltransferase [Actinomycetota bacterium]MBV6507834.1 putative diacylglycerol O-acyltransferase [Acidimicrobiales bacterium]RIK06044.1 MAG: wax ester/triacylglycerol synthase family O-acyltransferase [Acidobacteriota bacterium]